ncbi:hypothetical protein J4410_07620 [Candidatus Woesearchaeota archaeon]|nr:hypothetical protein [Candidatus Woesearchaeota archaeon]
MAKTKSSDMASGTCPTSGCPKQCKMFCGAVLLLVGILYLLQENGSISWWTYNWWTVVFILFGLKKIVCSMKCG